MLGVVSPLYLLALLLMNSYGGERVQVACGETHSVALTADGQVPKDTPSSVRRTESFTFMGIS